MANEQDPQRPTGFFGVRGNEESANDPNTRPISQDAVSEEDRENQEDQLPDRDTDVSTKKEDGSVRYKVPGSALPVRSVDTESDDYNDRQTSALLRYRVTGVVGDFIDPLRDQEPDIAPEFGISPHPELHNPPPPKNAVGSVASKTRLTASVEDKVEADDPSVAQGLSAG